MEKNNKKLSNSSLAIIVVSCISVLLLVVYVGTSFTSKGTYSVSTRPVILDADYCIVHLQPAGDYIKEERHIYDCDDWATDSNGNVLTCDTEEGRIANQNTQCFVRQGDTAGGQVQHVYGRCDLHDIGYWECEKEFISKYRCDKTTGLITYIAACRKYDDNHQINQEVMCGIQDYYLYHRSELAEVESCIAPGASVVIGTDVNGNLYESRVQSVTMCNTDTGKTIDIASCQKFVDDDGCATPESRAANANVKCFQGPITPRHTYPPTGYSRCSLVDKNDQACNTSTSSSSTSSSSSGSTSSSSSSSTSSSSSGSTSSGSSSSTGSSSSGSTSSSSSSSTGSSSSGSTSSSSSSGGSTRTCSFSYLGLYSNQIWLMKSDSNCPCEDIAGTNKWIETGYDNPDDPDAFKTCYTVPKSMSNGIYYEIGTIGSCYTAAGYVENASGTRCIKCDTGYSVNNNACVKNGSSSSSSTGSSSSGSTSSSSSSGTGSSSGSSGNNNVVVDVKAANNNTETVEATREVTKLVDKIVEGKSVSGIDSNLKTKIEDAVEAEKTVLVEVETANVEATSVSSDAQKVKAKINNTDKKVAAYYDVEVAIKVDNRKVGNVTQLDNKITVSVPIPDDLPTVPTGYRRQYKIIMVHDGVAEEITPSVSGDNLLFKTNKFSTYAVVYEDVYQSSGSSQNSQSSGNTQGSSNNNIQNPQTSTTGIIIAWIVGFLAIGYACYYFAVVSKSKD